MLAIAGGDDDQGFAAGRAGWMRQLGDGHARGLAHGVRGRSTSRDSRPESGSWSVGGFQRDCGGIDGAGFGVVAFMVVLNRVKQGMEETGPAGQAFNWRRPSASIQRARLRRTSESMPCTGRGCWRRPLARTGTPLVKFSCVRLNTLQVGAAVFKPARHQNLALMGAGLFGSSYLRASGRKRSASPSSSVMARMASRNRTRSKPRSTSKRLR